MKRILSALLLCSMLLSFAVPLTVSAATISFVDVPSNAWFYESVSYVAEKGYFKGTDATHFSPNMKTNRASLVTVLYRIAGSPDVRFQSIFSDVPDGMYFSEPVIWAYQNDIVKGTSTTTFSPTNNITREQIVTILYRYARKFGMNASASGDLSEFNDSNTVGNFAELALEWATGIGLIKGADGNLNPKGDAMRSEIAAMIHRFDLYMLSQAETKGQPWMNYAEREIMTAHGVQLEAVFPGEENPVITWSVDNENAVVSDAGLVTGKTPGVSVITATYGGKSATCTVTVLRSPFDVARDYIVKNANSTYNGEKTLTKGGQLEGKYGVFHVLYSSADDTIQLMFEYMNENDEITDRVKVIFTPEITMSYDFVYEWLVDDAVVFKSTGVIDAPNYHLGDPFDCTIKYSKASEDEAKLAMQNTSLMLTGLILANMMKLSVTGVTLNDFGFYNL